MAFGNKLNSHDAWVKLIAESGPRIQATGLPVELFGTRSRLIDYLTEGKSADVPSSLLQDLSDAQFHALWRLIQDFGAWESSGWTAYWNEASRRSGRMP